MFAELATTISFQNHPLDLFGDKAKDERIVADLEKMFGLKITRGDGLPSRTCRSCYVKIGICENDFRV